MHSDHEWSDICIRTCKQTYVVTIVARTPSNKVMLLGMRPAAPPVIGPITAHVAGLVDKNVPSSTVMLNAATCPHCPLFLK
jgi:hypothetical protein